MRDNPSGVAFHAWWVILTLVAATLVSTAAVPDSAQTGSSPGAPNPGPSCGWHSQNSSTIVASSPAGSAVRIAIGEPSWEQDCFSFPGPAGSTSGTSFPAYEVFPITVHASPGVTVELEAGTATPTAQQIAEDGVRNTTIWTWFNPASVTADSSGLARSNLTLAGAVMPFVPNDISNVSLPIVAVASAGGSGSAGLPIEFEGGNSGGVIILQTPGPIEFGSGIGGQVGEPSDPLFSVVYSPPSSATAPTPLQVSLKVLGTYDNGKVGPMPSDVQVSFPQSSFELQPNSVLYLPVSENNSLKPSNLTSAANYTFAVQETVGSNTYVEPLAVSVSLMQIFAGGSGPSQSSTTTTSAPAPAGGTDEMLTSPIAEVALVLAAAALIVIVTVVALRRRERSRTGEPEIRNL